MAENYNQFIRKCEVFLANSTQALDVSQFRIQFNVKQMDSESPNNASIKIYNMSDDTVSAIKKQFTKISLNAGYANGNYGQIFTGNIKQFYKGRDNNVDSYLEVMAGEGDETYNYAFLNQTLGSNSTPEQRSQVAAASLGLNLSPSAIAQNKLAATGGILPRGKVLFGLARSQLRTLANTHLWRWSVSGGKIVQVPNTGYLEGTIIKVNSQTGMIGYPEATDEGVKVRCLINPAIVIGGRLEIDNKLISQTSVLAQGYPNYTSLSFPALTRDDGQYRIIVHEFVGDTRGHDWYSEITCLAIDTTQPAANSVAPA